MNQTSRPAAETFEALSQADMVDAVVDLAKTAVRSAVAAGGDPAAGVLRLLLNELSPMPTCMAPSDSRSASRPEGAADAETNEAHARFMLGLATLKIHKLHKRRFTQIAAALAPHLIEGD